MTAVKDFIVAIELGSSKITGIAGKKNSDGSIQVLAYAREEASAFIRKGIIYNINKTALGLTSIVNKLEEQLDASIAKVYVGIGGQSLHSRKNFIVERMDTETIITSDIVNQLIKSNQQTHYQDLDILDVVPQEYKVKNNNLIDPIGVVGNQIEGHFLNIVARSSIKRNILTCFEQAEIAKFSPQELKLYEDNVKAYRDIMNAIATARKDSREEGRAEGRAEGLAEGRAEGLAEGMEKGRQDAMLETVRNLRSYGMSDAQIAAALKMDAQAVGKIT